MGSYKGLAFDIAVSQEVIEHFSDQAIFIRTAHEVLRPGGYLILTTPNASVFDEMPLETCKKWMDQPIENHLTMKELNRLLKTRDFTDISISSFISHHNNRWPYLLSRLLSRGNPLSSYESIRAKLGYGLHSLAIAKKPY